MVTASASSYAMFVPRSGADRSLDTPVLDKDTFFLDVYRYMQAPYGICITELSFHMLFHSACGRV